jgi:hypothetical protein
VHGSAWHGAANTWPMAMATELLLFAAKETRSRDHRPKSPTSSAVRPSVLPSFSIRSFEGV